MLKALQELNNNINYIKSFPEYTTPELHDAFASIIENIGQLNISPKAGTSLICSSCYSVNAEGYKLKRSGGKYLALCVDENGGCAGKDVGQQCGYTDHMGVACDELAEYQIMYGKDKIISSYACLIHTGALLKDTEQTVYPIK